MDDDIEEMRIEESRASSAASQSNDGLSNVNANVGMSIKSVLTSTELRIPLIIGIVMQLSQQLSGINAVLYYSTTIFVNAGLSEDNAKFATIGVGGVMVIMTLVSIPLMDKSGRRTLQLWGLGGMFISSIFFTISLLVTFIYNGMTVVSVISLLLFVVFFALGPGSIPWMITAELFAQGPRPAAMSIAVLVNWSTNFAVGLSFPLMMVSKYLIITRFPTEMCLTFSQFQFIESVRRLRLPSIYRFLGHILDLYIPPSTGDQKSNL